MLVLFLALACNTAPEPEGPIRSAEFGVLYGGQVQQRDEIPFELDRTQQTVGLSIEFREPLAAPATVAWEIDMPGTNLRVRDVHGRRGKGRLVKLDQAIVPAGQTRFDQVLPFEPGDSLGVWNIRVRVNDQIVIDRPFEVYSEAHRRRAMARLDAGAPL